MAVPAGRWAQQYDVFTAAGAGSHEVAYATVTASPATGVTLQLAAPATLPFGAYRVIDYLVEASATVGDGIRRFARFGRVLVEVCGGVGVSS